MKKPCLLLIVLPVVSLAQNVENGMDRAQKAEYKYIAEYAQRSRDVTSSARHKFRAAYIRSRLPSATCSYIADPIPRPL